MERVEKEFHYGVVKKSVSIKASKDKIWQKISNIVSLNWVLDITKTVFLSKKQHGVGAIRKIIFDDGSKVIEHIVGWQEGKYISYVAVSGLPLRAYHATISVTPKNKTSSMVTWQSFFDTEKMSMTEFLEFSKFLGLFYEKSLANLKACLEK
jgi:hypothetical protein